MKKSEMFKWIIAALVFLYAIAGLAATDEVRFQHKTRGNIKTGCYKFQGKHDAFPRYECPDSSGKLIPFDPKDEWELIKGDDPLYEQDPNKPDVPKGDESDEVKTDSETPKPDKSETKSIRLFPGCASEKE